MSRNVSVVMPRAANWLSYASMAAIFVSIVVLIST